MTEEAEAEPTWREVFSRDDPRESLVLHALKIAYTLLFYLPALVLVVLGVPLVFLTVAAWALLATIGIADPAALVAAVPLGVAGLAAMVWAFDKGWITIGDD